MQLYVTGFGEFLTHKENPSSLCATSLMPLGAKGSILKVSYAAVDDFFRAHHPEGMLLFGLNAKADTFRFERYAYNAISRTTKDVDGIIPEQEYIEAGEGRQETAFPILRLCGLAEEKGIPIKISEDPGRYLCNYVYFKALKECQGKALFVHVPLKTKENEDFYPRLARMIYEELSRLGNEG